MPSLDVCRLKLHRKGSLNVVTDFVPPLSQTGTKSVTTFDFCIFGSLEAFTAMNPRKLLERMRLKILEHPVIHVPPPVLSSSLLII